MLKKTINYTDFDGVDQSEDYYFNLSKTELVKMQLSGENNDFSAQLTRISKSKNGKEIMNTFEMFIKESYGVRSEDGKRFMKSEQLYEEFKQSEAYDALFMELVTNANAAAAFIRGLVPADLAAQVDNEGNFTPAVQQEIAADVARAGASLDVSNEARKRSEQALQGHKKKDHEASDIVDVPSLPTVPVDEKFPTVPLVTKPKSLDDMSAEELEQELARRRSTS